MPQLSDLTEAQLKDRARKLREDTKVALSPKAQAQAARQLELVEKELAQRSSGHHPIRKTVSKFVARLGVDKG